MGGLEPALRRELGAYIRRLRTERGWTLQALAEQVGITPSALSQIERGQIEPSLSTLWQLSEALGVTLFQFFALRQPARVSVVRGSRERLRLEFGRLTYEVLAHSRDRGLDFFLLRLAPGQGMVREALTHPGEECGLVLQGVLRVHIGGEQFRLEPGDSIWFDSTQPHTFESEGDEECISVWAMTPPDYALFRAQRGAGPGEHAGKPGRPERRGAMP